MRKVFSTPFIFVFILCGLTNIFAQETKNQADFQEQKIIYNRVEIVLDDKADLDDIAALGIDLLCGVNMTHRNGKHIVTLELSTEQIAQLESIDFQPKILIENMADFYAKRAMRDLPEARENLQRAKLNALYKNPEAGQDLGCSEDGFPVPMNFNLGSMGGMYTYQEMLNALDQMRSLYPNLITARTPTSTTITTIEGRDVFYVRLSDNPDVDENEAEVLYTGLHHAREPMSMMNLIYYMWYLLENYAADPKVKNIVDNTELYFIPMINPDGYIYNETTNPNGGGFWRKNRRNNGGSFGVDLNRNYDYQWGYNNSGSSGSSSSDTYRGSAPFSEPETQMVRDFVQSHNFTNAFNNHAYSNVIIRPWGYASVTNAEDELFEEMSEHMCWHNRYDYGDAGYVIYNANGVSDDWFYGLEDVFSWSPEVGAANEGGFWPSPSNIVPQCERQMKMSLILASSAANYGILNDLTPYDLDPANPTLIFSVEHMSNVDGGFTVNVSSGSPYVTAIANPTLTTGNLTQANFATMSTGVTIAPGTPQGTAITFDVVLNNGTYDIHTTTITKTYNAAVLFSDNVTNLNNWTSSGGWNTTNSTGYNDAVSITDSPSGNMSNATRTLTLNTPIDLSVVQSPVLEYYTKWDITKLYDYVQIEVSTNGTSWAELCGVYTKPGTSSDNVFFGNPDQPTGEGLYDGLQKEWVREEIDLSAYAGITTFYLRFKADGDNEATHRDGFYLDDLVVYGDAPACAGVDLDINFDGTPPQTSWDITDSNGNVVASSSGTYSTGLANTNLPLTDVACLPDGCYDLTFYDSVNNGMCPFRAVATSSGTFITPGTIISPGTLVATLGTVVTPGLCGDYTLTDANGTVLASGGGSFGASEANNFCISGGVAELIQPDVDWNTEKSNTAVDLQILPNLVADEMTVIYSLKEMTHAELHIIDINGKVLQQHTQSAKGVQEVRLNVGELAAGFYFMRLVAGDVVITKKFIKQ